MIIKEVPNDERNSAIEEMEADDLRFKVYKLKAQRQGLLSSLEKYKNNHSDAFVLVENQLIEAQKQVGLIFFV